MDGAPRARTNSDGDRRDDSVGLCLSGGGYRAMLFHTGALWRLNDLGWLPRLDFVSSVSGGSLAAGVLGRAWSSLTFDSDGVAKEFEHAVVDPVRSMAGTTVDVPSALRGLLKPWRSVGGEVARSYRKHLFGKATLQDLPETPRFVFTAANLQNGVLWRFSRKYMRDYRFGGVRSPAVPLATAVAASSAFPPFLSPVVLPIGEWTIDGELPDRPPKVVLGDGGIYDNLGLQPVIDRCGTVLVSDCGGTLPVRHAIDRFWPTHMVRVLYVIDNQVRSQRKRALIKSLTAGEFGGTYWGSYSDIAHYELDDALPAPVSLTGALAATPTRLTRLPALTQQRLVNWGYAIADAGMRRWVDNGAAAPGAFPYPDAGVG